MNRVICFDLWNTLIRSLTSGASYEEVLVELGGPRAEIYPFVRDQLMTTERTYTEMIDELFNHFKISSHAQERDIAATLWEEDNQRAIWFSGAQKLLSALQQQGDTLVLITNITAPAWNTVNPLLNLEIYFSLCFLSYAQGVSKPHPSIWQNITAGFPSTTEFWMIGDNQADDLDIPESMGWNTQLVTKNGYDLSNLREKLCRKS